MSIWRQARAIIPLPAVVVIFVPATIVYLTGTVHVGWGLPIPLSPLPPAAGGVLIVVGLTLVGWTVAMFSTVGEGTLAPWDAPRRLVVRGVYRHVRNPMISGVVCVLLGESVLLGSPALLGWFVGFFFANAVYLPLVEERGLERRFGEVYRVYKENVPRWMPRRRPWLPDPGRGDSQKDRGPSIGC